MRITYPFEITRFWTKTFAFFADARQYVGMSALTPLTTSEAAGVYGVSPRTIAYAKKAISIGSAALVAALETGRISVLGAAWLADNADASVQDWVVADPRRAVIRRRLRIARRDPEAAERAAGWRNPRTRPRGDGVPRAVLIPIIRNVAVAAARAASRAAFPRGRPPSESGEAAPKAALRVRCAKPGATPASTTGWSAAGAKAADLNGLSLVQIGSQLPI